MFPNPHTNLKNAWHMAIKDPIVVCGRLIILQTMTEWDGKKDTFPALMPNSQTILSPNSQPPNKMLEVNNLKEKNNDSVWLFHKFQIIAVWFCIFGPKVGGASYMNV